MTTIGSDEAFLKFYHNYSQSDPNPLMMVPKEKGDFRERVERETIRGRYGIFHHNIETYLYRHWRAFTVPRMGMFAFGTFSLMWHGIF